MRSSIINTSLIKAALALAVAAVLVLFASLPAFATESDVPAPAEDITTVGADEQPAQISEKSVKAIVAAAIVGLVASVGAVGMTIAVSKSTSNMARQPEASDKISSSTMLGLVFIETTIIYALIVAVLVVFVL